MAEIDSLQIKINAEATKANDAIDRLVGKLDRLTTSLSKINGTNLNGLANGVQRLGAAMQTMNNIKTADFTRLATNLTRLGSVNTSALNSAASSMSHLTRAFNSLGTVSANAQAVGEMARNISKLGNKSVQTAITNIPQLAKAMNNLMATLSKSPKVSRNVIQMTNALANLANQGSKVGSASNSIVRGLNRTSTSANTAKKSFGGLASAIGKFYATYFMVIRGLKGLWRSIESTADYIEAYNYFNVSLGKIGADWSHQFDKYGYDNAESYAESFGKRLTESLGKLSGVQISVGADGKGLLTETGMKNLGLNIQEITQYASQLASVTNSVGQTGETSLAIASSFTKLAGDISSLFNVDYSSVAKNLQSGLIGQSRALYKYGIDITNATLQTKAYELGLSKAVSEMTQAEKMQLRTLAILEQSKVSWGDLANTINSPSNMIRQFKNNLKEAGLVLGQLFMPALKTVLPIVNGVTIAIKRLLVNIAGLLGIKIDLDSFGKGYTDMEDNVDGITDSYEDATKAAEEWKNQLLGFDKVNKLSEPTETSDSGSTGTGIDLTDEIVDATSEYEKAWEKAYQNMQNKSEKFANAIAKKLKPISKIFSDIAKGDWISLGKDTSKLVKSIFNFFTNAIKKVNWHRIGTSIGDFLSNVDWIGIFKAKLKFLVAVLQSVLETYMGMWKTAPVETAIISMFALMKFKGLGKILGDALSTALKRIPIPIKKGAIGLSLAATSIGLSQSKDTIARYVGTAITAMLSALTFGASIPLTIGIGALTVTAISVKDVLKKAIPWYFESNVIGTYEVTVVLGVSYENVKNAVAELNEEFETFRENSKKNIEASEGESEYITKLWQDYGKLADKESKSNTEKAKLKFLAEELIKKIPELSEYIDAETGEYKGQKEEIKKVIEQTKKKIQVEALQAEYTEAIKQQIKAEKQLREITENPDYINALKKKEIAQGKVNAAEKIYQDFIKKHPNYSEYTKEEIKQFDDLGIAVGDAEEELRAANKAVDTWNAELDNAGTVFENASKDVDFFGEKLGYASDETNKAKTSIKRYKDEAQKSCDKIRMESAKMAGEVVKSFSTIVFPKLKANFSPVLKGTKTFKETIQDLLNEIKMPDLSKGFSLNNVIEIIKNSKDSFQAAFKEIFSGKSNSSKSTTVQKKAGGGFVSSGQLFVAREAGPELVGTMKGKTAVANNDQIVSGISIGVSNAVYDAMTQVMSSANNSSNSGTIVVQIDGKEVFRAVQKQADNYTIQNGKPAFIT